MRRPTRREVLIAGTACTLGAAISPPTVFARGEELPERHGMSAFGDLKYPADFTQFAFAKARSGCSSPSPP
jgi:microcin C transport system substrate-binding protein